MGLSPRLSLENGRAAFPPPLPSFPSLSQRREGGKRGRDRERQGGERGERGGEEGERKGRREGRVVLCWDARQERTAGRGRRRPSAEIGLPSFYISKSPNTIPHTAKKNTHSHTSISSLPPECISLIANALSQANHPLCVKFAAQCGLEVGLDHRLLFLRYKVTRVHLGVDLDMGVCGNELVRDGHPLNHTDA